MTADQAEKGIRDMAKKLTGWISRRTGKIAFISTVLCSISGVAAAQMDMLNPDKTAELAEKNPLVALCYVFAVVAIVMGWFAWKQTSTIIAQQETIRVMAEAHGSKLDRLIDRLDARPCILNQPDQPHNPNRLHV